MTSDERDALLFMLAHDDPSVVMNNVRDYLEHAKAADQAHEEVEAECQRQVELWGGEAHDDGLDPYDWCRILIRHAVKAEMALSEDRNDEWRGRVVQVAAIAMSALRSHDRKEGRR